jgi:CRP/FNR family transcriptional regulator, cyclic AMP receptor protein
MASMLELAAHLPELDLQPGDQLCAEGGRSGSIWVLVEGRLSVMKSDVQVNVIDQPGAIIGEVAVLLGTGNSATVVAETPTRVRYAQDGDAFLHTHPEISTFVARGLADRLNFVTTYLADLKHQYGDAPGLAMVGDVLSRLAARKVPPARPGSARDPDPEY